MALSIATRRRIDANQKACYADAFSKLRQDLDNVQIGSVDMFILLNKAKKEHHDQQSSQQLINRFNALTDRISSADNRDVVKHIFQWSN